MASYVGSEPPLVDVIISYFLSEDDRSSRRPRSSSSKQNNFTGGDLNDVTNIPSSNRIPLVTLSGIPTTSSWSCKMLKDCILYRYFQFLQDNLSNPEEEIGELYFLWLQYLESNVDISDRSSEYFKLTNLAILEVEHLLMPNVLSIFKNPPEHYFIAFSGNNDPIHTEFTIRNMLDELQEKCHSTSKKKKELSKLYIDLRSSDANPHGRSQESFHLKCDFETYRQHTDIRGKKYYQYQFKLCIDDNSISTWSVRKRYSDFETLHENLVQLSRDKGSVDFFDISTLPPLPSKFSNTEPEHRKVIFLAYMQELVKLADMHPNRYILSFLGLLNDSLLSPVDESNIETSDSNGSGNGGNASRHVLHISRLNYEVDTGDIVLFKSKTKASQIQRMVTGSEWDHVGVVIRVTNASYLKMKDFLSSEQNKRALSKSPSGVDTVNTLISSIKNTLASIIGDKKSDTARHSVTANSITLKTRVGAHPGKEYGYEASKLDIRSSGRSGSQLLCILECTGEGVTLLPLQARIKAYTYYDCCHYIAVRRLNISDNMSWEKAYSDPMTPDNSELLSKRTCYDVSKISTFLSTVVGLPYSFRVDSIASAYITSQSVVADKEREKGSAQSNKSDGNKIEATDDDNDTENSDRFTSEHIIQPAYFCSELIAAMLKVLKVLPITVKNNSLWPGSFSSGDIMDKIILAPHSFGSEMLIDCRVNDINDMHVAPSSTHKTPSGGANQGQVSKILLHKSGSEKINYTPPVFDHHLLATFVEKPSLASKASSNQPQGGAAHETPRSGPVADPEVVVAAPLSTNEY